nr:MAG TPA: excisionase [Caudoviricetes sp.]
MNDLLLHQLGKALYLLEREGNSLNDLLFPTQGGSGENVGKPSSRRGSTPPVNLAMLDLKLETENTLAFWAMQVPHDAGDAPASRSIVDGARWLQSHLGSIDDAPWGELAAQEIIAQAQLVAGVVSDSGEDDVCGDPPEFVSCRVAASWMKNMGRPVDQSTVYRWAKRKAIRVMATDGGGLLVSLADVIDRCSVGSRQCNGR